jgi:hypothetical protein
MYNRRFARTATLYDRVVSGSGSPSARAGCVLCGRPTYDPDKKERPWSRGVSEGRQVLICPICQMERPDWTEVLDRCGSCGSTRLSVMLGEVICRQCGQVGAVKPEEPLLG